MTSGDPASRPSLLARRLAWKQLERRRGQLCGPPGDPTDPVETRVALLSTFTIAPLVPYLGVEMDARQLAPAIHSGPFGQTTAELLDPASATRAFAPDTLVLWPTFEDLWTTTPLDAPIDAAVDVLVDLAETAARAASDQLATLVFVLPALPLVRPLGVGDAANSTGVAAAAYAAREACRGALAGRPGVLVADAEDVVRSLGTAAVIDARRWFSARIPWTEVGFAAIADRLARLLALARYGARKVAVVDADNTLWGGVVGELGASGIDLLENGPGEAFRAFQRYLLDLRGSGMLVALASKNNEADVWEAFGRREMVLKQEHLSGWRVNWAAKAANIDDLTAELNLGLGAAAFIDDSPMELDSVAATLPEVATIAFPADPADWIVAVGESGVLDRLPPTTSDLTRAGSYAAETQRRLVSHAMTQADYLASLELEISIFAPRLGDVGRLAQLVAKTNQFTLDRPRHAEAVLAEMGRDDAYAIRLVEAADRFGDYGVVGAFIVGGRSLDTFVLSCRAMSRGIEQAMLAAAGESAGGYLDVVVHDGQRNAPARTFFAAWTDPPNADGAPNADLSPVEFVRRLSTPPWPAHIRRLDP